MPDQPEKVFIRKKKKEHKKVHHGSLSSTPSVPKKQSQLPHSITNLGVTSPNTINLDIFVILGGVISSSRLAFFFFGGGGTEGVRAYAHGRLDASQVHNKQFHLKNYQFLHSWFLVKDDAPSIHSVNNKKVSTCILLGACL